ncbi:MAG: aconitase X [Granulosicoccaceae bacterium]
MADNHALSSEKHITGSVLVSGAASGELLVSDVGISFWGGVDPLNGNVIDEHHPLFGENVSGKVLVIPSGRGSCSGSGALLELLINDCAPAALVFTEAEDILTLGVLVAEAMFDRSLPVLRISTADSKQLVTGAEVAISHSKLQLSNNELSPPSSGNQPPVYAAATDTSHISLSRHDQQVLNGLFGDAAKMAMQIILRIATIQGADRLIDVHQAHIDACIYHGPSSLKFAQELLKRNAKVRIPTTLNSISIDERRWQDHGVDKQMGIPASQLAYAFIEMGARASYTCAPYLLSTAPVFGEQIVWAESNAVMFANSVIGARTQKYPDFLDIFIALTARAPASGGHLDAGRNPTVCIQVPTIKSPDDSFWPLLGYHVGLKTPNELPMIYGLEALQPSMDDLKAFSAAFATTSSASMFHIHSVTPEAELADQYCELNGLLEDFHMVTMEQLLGSFKKLNTAQTPAVDMICLGNPHFSITECEKLVNLCHEKTKHDRVRLLITMGRDVYDSACEAGYVTRLESFGVEFITDTCWCMITEPVIPESAKHLMTNSGKYAHYGPALVKRDMHFGSLSACVDAACNSVNSMVYPQWLSE